MELRGKRWTNSLAVEKIAGKRIRSLELFNTAVDDDFLETVARNGTLTSIHISSETITDRGITSIAAQNPVKSFMLSGVPNVTDDCMNTIGDCKTIRELYIDGTSVTDDGVESIGDLPDLWSLVIGNTSITDAGIKKIASKTIDLISFDNCPITGSGFSTWNQSEKMSFYCNASDLTDDGFAVALLKCGILTSRILMWATLALNRLTVNHPQCCVSTNVKLTKLESNGLSTIFR